MVERLQEDCLQDLHHLVTALVAATSHRVLQDMEVVVTNPKVIQGMVEALAMSLKVVQDTEVGSRMAMWAQQERPMVAGLQTDTTVLYNKTRLDSNQAGNLDAALVVRLELMGHMH
jgi:hypothetical protein